MEDYEVRYLAQKHSVTMKAVKEAAATINAGDFYRMAHSTIFESV